jgi:hypothetical protein
MSFSVKPIRPEQPNSSTSATRPSSPEVGQTIFETDTKYTRLWNGSSWETIGFSGQYKLGDTGPGGGEIFFVDYLDRFNNFNYLEAAEGSAQFGNITWATGSNQAEFVQVNRQTLGEGYDNTNTISAQSGNEAVSCAALYCQNLVFGGVNDWYLPSTGELFALRNHFLTTAQNFTFDAQYYWSSNAHPTFFNGNQAIRFSPLSGQFEYASKSSGNTARPIRRFS